jgi:hypothetical protein
LKTVLYVLLATALTFLSCYSLGSLLLRLLRVKVSRSEERFFSFVGGAALLSTLVFFLTASGLAMKSVFIGATVPFILASVGRSFGLWRGSGPPEDTVSIPLTWQIIFWSSFALFTYVYLANAMMPETSADGMAYHVALPATYLRAHRFPHITTNMYANLSEGVEMLFLYAFSIGKHTAAAMTEFLFLLALPFGILSYARRIGHPRAGVVGALLAYASPVVGRAGTIAYVDVAAGVVAFALFYAVQIWRERSSYGLSILIGVLAGFGYAIKYPGFVGVIYALALMLAVSDWRKRLPHAALAATCAFAVMAPWLIKNAVFVSNPFSPFLNRYFPNPYIYTSFEKSYVDQFRHMNGVQLQEIPVEAAVRGTRLTGLTGPVFLLAPLALLGLRRREVRQLLLAAAVYLVPYFGNIGTRFLIPALPFTALALALVIDRFRFAAPLVLGVHLFLSWPSVIPSYAGQYPWQIEGVRWGVALRRVPEEEYLKEVVGEYEIVRAMDKIVPAEDMILSPGIGARAYHSRRIVIGYESAFGNRMIDLLYRAIDEGLHTTRRHVHALATTACRLRLVQTAANPDPVNIAELRVFSNGAELQRSAAWRLSASVNPWDVPAAFDNSPLTVWMPGRETTAGTYVQIDFGAPTRIDRATADITQGQRWAATRIDIDAGDGHWRTVSESADVKETEWLPRMRRAAMDELKANGIQWIVIQKDDALAPDLAERDFSWGIQPVATSGEYRLYHID